MKGLVIVLMLIGSCGYGQISFTTSYGNSGYDFARDVRQDTDTGYVVTGSSSSFGSDNADAYILKVDKNGSFMWSYNYGGPGSDWGQELLVTNDSTYALTGFTNSSGAGGFDFYLVRAAADGSPLWERTYGGADWDKSYGIVEMLDSGFVLVGETSSFNNGVKSAYIVRTDKNGDTLWTYVENNTEPSFLRGVALDGDSIVVCGGIGDGGQDTYDGFIMKMHIDGTVGWNQIVGQSDNDYFNAIFSVNGIYSLGGVRSYDYANFKEDMWMYRINDDGTLVIDISYAGAAENDAIHDVAVRDFDQDYYFAGETKSFGFMLDGLSDVMMAKMTIGGVYFAEQTFGAVGEDVAYGIERTYDNGIVIAGDTKNWSIGGTNAFIMKITSSWVYPWWPTDLTTDDITTSISNNSEAQILHSHPNPLKDIITIPFFETGTLFIHDISGKLIHTSEINSTSIDLGFLSSGSYILSVDSNNKIFQQKIIKL